LLLNFTHNVPPRFILVRKKPPTCQYVGGHKEI
jgi:hypothetical protein